MSKKTVLFKMPVKDISAADGKSRSDDRSPADGKRRRSPLPGGVPTVAVSTRAKLEAKKSNAFDQDEWVQHRDADHVSDPAPAKVARPSVVPAGAKSVTIDVAAERDLREVVALSLIVPPVLGWFWLSKLMNRYWSAFG